MSDPLLQLELRLLILRHGKRRVLEGLATLGEQTLEALEAELAAINEGGGRKKSKTRKPELPEIITRECRSRPPEVTDVIQRLATKFENRMFLPELRDVHRFLERFGGASSGARPKTRSVGIVKVVHVLAGMELDALKRLADTSAPVIDSDYAVLARQIMGRGSANADAEKSGTGERKSQVVPLKKESNEA